MNYVDTHFHLDLWEKPQVVAERIEQSKIYTIAVTNAPSVFHFTHNLSKGKKYLRAALGLHPELVRQRAGELPLFFDKISQTRYIGEIGLDFSGRNILSKELQLEVFEKIIDRCSNDGNKIITIHSRKAEKEIVEIIGNNFPGKVILHWYSGPIKSLETAIDCGFYFSINYRMAISKVGQDIVNRIPLSRILTESDGPFISVNRELNNPMAMKFTCDQIAEVLNNNNIKGIAYKNFRDLISKSTQHRL